MAVPYPALVPSAREFTPGSIPIVASRTLNGRTVLRPLATKGSGDELELEHQNITDTAAGAIWQAWQAADIADTVDLPVEVWAGDAELRAYATLQPGETWRFAGPPTLEWAKRGRVTARVRLIKRFRTGVALPPAVPDIEPPPPLPLEYRIYAAQIINADITLFSRSADGTVAQWQADQSAAFIAADKSIYWGFLATQAGVRRYAVLKFDKSLNFVWGAWLNGPYYVQAPSTSGLRERCLICDGPNNGVFFAASCDNVTNIGRVWRFSVDGNLEQAVWLKSASGYDSGPSSLLYDATNDWLWLRCERGFHVRLKATTLGSIVARDMGVGTSSGGHGLWYIKDKARIVSVGWNAYNGWTVTEYDNALATRYQLYDYTDSAAANAASQRMGYGVDNFGSPVLISSPSYPPARDVDIRLLSSSDSGYQPLWRRRFTTPAGQSVVDAQVGFMSDNSPIVIVRQTSRWLIYRFLPDWTSYSYCTTINLSGNANTYRYFLDADRQELVVKNTGAKALVKTSLRLPVATTTLALTATGTQVTGSTDYTVTPTVLQGTTALTRASMTHTDSGYTVAQFSEAAWSTSDFSATVQLDRAESAPLVVP